ncbi:MAG: NAD(P) transhydrogenase subunit alpha [Leptospiraceae bacterium]|nr:NAD(P) transhydrogenase subunit alpha [Leptospiraceae bacterium]
MEEYLGYFLAYRYLVYIVLLSTIVGIEIISKAPAILQAPLTSGINAIHGVLILGAIIVMGNAKEDDVFSLVLGFIAVILASIHVVGGFVLTDRILFMFKKKSNKK